MKSLIIKLIKKFYSIRGWEIVLKKYKIYKGEFPQSIVLPKATYSPWLGDEPFLVFYDSIKNNTLVTLHKCYELWILSQEVSGLKGDFIEIGVWRGGSGAIISKIANDFSPDSNVYLCDTFKGVVKAGVNDNTYTNNEHSDATEEVVKDLLKKLNLRNTKILFGIFPDDTSHLVENNLFKFCHIDVDVYEGASQCTRWVWDRLVIGGIIVYDDYGSSGTQGVTKFVNSQRNKDDRIVIHNLNGHGIIIKIK